MLRKAKIPFLKNIVSRVYRATIVSIASKKSSASRISRTSNFSRKKAQSALSFSEAHKFVIYHLLKD